MDLKLQWAIGQILDKTHPKFFGDVVLTFQNGIVYAVKVNEIINVPKDIDQPA